eukprot:c20968_g1_i1.p1 GENE.c20968_g1_i1~~c20968_g1_i1.p1  ORF type:complete len:859 (-),score=172.77 c20968_g1_i1:32-2608(-)
MRRSKGLEEGKPPINSFSNLDQLLLWTSVSIGYNGPKLSVRDCLSGEHYKKLTCVVFSSTIDWSRVQYDPVQDYGIQLNFEIIADLLRFGGLDFEPSDLEKLKLGDEFTTIKFLTLLRAYQSSAVKPTLLPAAVRTPEISKDQPPIRPKLDLGNVGFNNGPKSIDSRKSDPKPKSPRSFTPRTKSVILPSSPRATTTRSGTSAPTSPRALSSPRGLQSSNPTTNSSSQTFGRKGPSTPRSGSFQTRARSANPPTPRTPNAPNTGSASGTPSTPNSATTSPKVPRATLNSLAMLSPLQTQTPSSPVSSTAAAAGRSKSVGPLPAVSLGTPLGSPNTPQQPHVIGAKAPALLSRRTDPNIRATEEPKSPVTRIRPRKATPGELHDLEPLQTQRSGSRTQIQSNQSRSKLTKMPSKELIEENVRIGPFPANAVITSIDIFESGLVRSLVWMFAFKSAALSITSDPIRVKLKDVVSGAVYKPICDIIRRCVAPNLKMAGNPFDYAFRVLNAAGCQMEQRFLMFFIRNNNNMAVDSDVLSYHKWLCGNLLERLATVLLPPRTLLKHLTKYTVIPQQLEDEVMELEPERLIVEWLNAICSTAPKIRPDIQVGNLDSLVQGTKHTKHFAYVLAHIFEEEELFRYEDVQGGEDQASDEKNWAIICEASRLLEVRLPFANLSEWQQEADEEGKWLRIAYFALMYSASSAKPLERRASDYQPTPQTKNHQNHTAAGSSPKTVGLEPRTLSGSNGHKAVEHEALKPRSRILGAPRAASQEESEDEDDDLNVPGLATVTQGTSEDVLEEQRQLFLEAVFEMSPDRLASMLAKFGMPKIVKLIRDQKLTGQDIDNISLAQLVFFAATNDRQ